MQNLFILDDLLHRHRLLGEYYVLVIPIINFDAQSRNIIIKQNVMRVRIKFLHEPLLRHDNLLESRRTCRNSAVYCHGLAVFGHKVRLTTSRERLLGDQFLRVSQ